VCFVCYSTELRKITLCVCKARRIPWKPVVDLQMIWRGRLAPNSREHRDERLDESPRKNSNINRALKRDVSPELNSAAIEDE
jgi:hypothetical protein